jgi:hypothetical protein
MAIAKTMPMLDNPISNVFVKEFFEAGQAP